MAEKIAAQLRVEPGTPARLHERDPASTLGPEFESLSAHELKQQRAEGAGSGRRGPGEAPRAALGERFVFLAGRLPGARRGREGQRDRARDVGRQPARRAGRVVQAALGRGARSRLPVEDRAGAPGAGPHRDLQSVALRGSRRPAGASRVAGRAAATAGRPRDAILGGPLRGHQRVRAAPAPQRNENREVLPPPLEGGAEAAVHRSPRQPRQALEVQRRRCRGAAALGRVHDGVRAGHHGHVDAVGAVVRGSRRQQTDHPGGRRA